MNTDPRISPDTPPTGWHGLLRRPSTWLGRWSVALAVAYLVLYVVDIAVLMQLADNAPWRSAVVPPYAIVMLACGLGAGIVGLMAILRQHERSWIAWLGVCFGLTSLLLIIGKVVGQH